MSNGKCKLYKCRSSKLNETFSPVGKMRTWSLEGAKKNLDRVIEDAERGNPQRITTQANEAVVVISVEQYEQVRRGLPATSFVEFLLTIPEGESFERTETEPRRFKPRRSVLAAPPL